MAAQFGVHRPRLHALASRMLGSRSEADDAVQDAWLRVGGADPESIDNLRGWLTTVTARICLDRLRSGRSRPEVQHGSELPHELADPAEDHDPAQQALVTESVGAALSVVLDTLAPAERVAFVLHDMFAVPFAEIAEVVERSPDATRQLASRARRRVRGATRTADVDLVLQRSVVEAFLRAARGGDLAGLLRLLDPNVVLRPDAAAVRMGSLRETRGAEEVAALLSGGAQAAQLALVDGIAALVWAPGGRVAGVIELIVRNGGIVAIGVTGDAERIRHLEIVTLDG